MPCAMMKCHNDVRYLLGLAVPFLNLCRTKVHCFSLSTDAPQANLVWNGKGIMSMASAAVGSTKQQENCQFIYAGTKRDTLEFFQFDANSCYFLCKGEVIDDSLLLSQKSSSIPYPIYSLLLLDDPTKHRPQLFCGGGDRVPHAREASSNVHAGQRPWNQVP